MKLLLFLLIIASHAVFAQQTQPIAGGINQPNEQFIKEQMRRQADQVNIDAAQRQQWDNIRTWRYIHNEHQGLVDETRRYYPH